MSQSSTEEFWRYLLEKYSVPATASARNRVEKPSNGEITLRAVLESTKIPVGDFANEEARFWRRPRFQLPQLLAATGLVGKFSRRFLIESAVFPFEGTDSPRLAMADPTDTAALRAAEIVLGGPVDVVVASFEDIATVLAERLGDDERDGATAADAGLGRSDD